MMESCGDIGFGARDEAPAIGFISAIIQSFLTRRAFFLNARFPTAMQQRLQQASC
jgi:hypothetical protein